MKKHVLALSSIFIVSFAFAQVFINKIPIPKLLTGTTFNLEADSARHNFNPKGSDSLNALVPTFCYNLAGDTTMNYLGPTLVWPKGQQLNITVNNKLNQRTTTHWHGLDIPSRWDGGPHEIINAGGSWNPKFWVVDPVQTVWYHPHLMDTTTLQVVKGMAGMIILQDTLNDTLYNRLPRTYGVNDIPLVIQEKGFIFNGGKATAINDGTVSGGGQPTNGVFTLVNGVVYGYVKVPRQVIRLRFLNGSARKTFYLGFSDTLAKPQSASFITNGKLIATDGGYTSKPISVDSFLMAPGERMEILLNLTGRAAKDSIFYLSNLVRSMPRDIISGTGNGNQTPSNAIASTPGNAFIKFIIDTTIQPANPVLTMPTFNTNYTVNPSNVRRQRTKNLILSTIGGNNVWTIDGQPMNMSVINDTVFINTKEIWTINNTTTVSHPFHIHKVQFQVMSVTDSNNVTTVPNDTNNLRYLRGFKDDVLIRSKSSYKLLMSFEDSFDMMIDTMNSFMYHCHILPHEDNSMMHQFVVIDSMLMYMGILHIDKDARFAVYPNPAATELRVKGSSANPITIRFIDLMGRVIREDRLDAFEHTSQTLPLADLPRGMVLMEITTKGKTEVKKILLH